MMTVRYKTDITDSPCLRYRLSLHGLALSILLCSIIYLAYFGKFLVDGISNRVYRARIPQVRLT